MQIYQSRIFAKLLQLISDDTLMLMSGRPFSTLVRPRYMRVTPKRALVDMKSFVTPFEALHLNTAISVNLF
jgi:hypothetical protein